MHYLSHSDYYQFYFESSLKSQARKHSVDFKIVVKHVAVWYFMLIDANNNN